RTRYHVCGSITRPCRSFEWSPHGLSGKRRPCTPPSLGASLWRSNRRNTTMFVDSILTGKGSTVVTVSSETTIGDLIVELARHNIGAVVVIDNSKLSGIVSERDIVRHLAGSAEGFRAQPVSSIMTRL